MQRESVHVEVDGSKCDASRISEILADVIRRRETDEPLSDEQIIQAHPDLMPALAARLRALRRIEAAEQRARSSPDGIGESTSKNAKTVAGAPDLLADSFPGYALLAEAHRGGQGVVYRAVQKTTHREVAVKVMREGPFHGARDKARFDREVRVLARLRHPNIVTIHDSGVAAGCHYLVMDYIHGEPLDAYVAARQLSLGETVELFATICEAVSAAHLRGVIHRDIKPSNILVDQQGVPYVLDFGLAKVTSGEATDISLARGMTLTGQFVGSLPWASPEQAGAQNNGLDLRTDVYSLGVVLYQVLTGRFPYPVVGNIREVLTHIVETEPAAPRAHRRDLDGEIATIILKCLAKDPERRYQSAGELARDLRHYLAGRPIEAKRDSTFYVLRKQMRRHRVSLAIGAAVLLLLIASSVVAWTLYARSRVSLWESYLAQAHAQRYSGRPGRSIESLKTLAKAVAIRPSIELRNEAIACLSLLDVRIEKLWPETTLDWREPWVDFDGNLAHYLVCDVPSGRTVVRRFEDNRELLNLPAASSARRAAPRLSPDGRYLARVVEDGCEVWEVARGSLLLQVSGEVAGFSQPLRFSPDNRELAIGMEDGSVRLCDLNTGQERTFAVLNAAVHTLRYHPSGRVLAASSTSSKDVVVWESQRGSVQMTLPHPAVVWAVGWSPDGTQLATCCADDNVYVWDAAAGQVQFTFRGHAGTPVLVEFESTGDLMYSYSWDGTTRLWDPRRGTHCLTVEGTIGLRPANGAARLGFCKGFDRLSYGVAEIVRSPTYQTLVGRLREAADRCRSTAVSPDGRLMMSGSEKGARLWDLPRGREIAYLPILRTPGVLFHPNGSALFTVGDRGILRWPVQRTSDLLRVGPPRMLASSAQRGFGSACLSADGSVLAAEVNQQEAIVLDLDGAVQTRIIGPHAGMSRIDLSPDRRLLVSGAWKGRGVKIWDLASGHLIHELPIPRDARAAFSPDGKWLATSAGNLSIWDTTTWQPVIQVDRWAGLESRIGAGPVAFSPDGALVAIVAHANGIALVEAATGQFLAHLECPEIIAIEEIAFAPDGTRLVVPDPCGGHVIHVWDLRAIRRELAAIGLDWDMPPYPPSAVEPPPAPLRLEVNMGDLAAGTDG